MTSSDIRGEPSSQRQSSEQSSSSFGVLEEELNSHGSSLRVPLRGIPALRHHLTQQIHDQKGSQMSNLVDHARTELNKIGEEPEVIEGYLKVIEAFANMNHSGGSASVAIPVINRLLQFKELSPISDDPEEWIEHPKAMWDNVNSVWQNRRNSEAFSNDGGQTYYLLSEGGSASNPKPIHHSVPHRQ